MRRRFGLALTFAVAIFLLSASAGVCEDSRPLDIPDSRVLKLTLNQYIAAYENKHNGDINEPETRALCYYWADLRRKENFRLARRLPADRRRLVYRCQSAFDSLSDACFDYHFSIEDGTMVYDFYAAQEPDSELTMRQLVDDLRKPGAASRAERLKAESDYRRARKNLRKTRPLIHVADASFFSVSERLAYYRKVESRLVAAKAILDILPGNARVDFAYGIQDIARVLDTALVSETPKEDYTDDCCEKTSPGAARIGRRCCCAL